MKNKTVITGKNAFTLIDEAIHMLRLYPVKLLPSYYIGTLPFIIGLLYFIADMSRSAYAQQHCAITSFGLALLFIWMKCWQSIFAERITAELTNRPPQKLRLGRLFHLAAVQAWIHMTGLVLLPVSFPIFVHIAWLYAFYQNVTACSHQSENGIMATVKESWKQAKRWPMQNHVLLLAISHFGIFVLLNIAVAMIMIPYLIKRLSGVETIFTMSGFSVLNTTFLAITLGLSYLCIDPLIKTVYTIRCFYGSAMKTGLDLRSDLRRCIAENASKTALVALLFILVCSASDVTGTESGDAAEKRDQTVSAEELDRSISEVLEQQAFTWRMPRPEKPEKDDSIPGPLQTLINWFRDILIRGLKAIGNAIESIVDWVSGLIPRAPEFDPPSDDSYLPSPRQVFDILLVVVLVILLVFTWKIWKRRKIRTPVVAAVPVSTAVDLSDENVLADKLPTNQWLDLAKEHLASGQYRLAIRAFYFATIKHLADHDLIIIKKYKSNRDYQRELDRRMHESAQLNSVFADIVSCFDKIWYGMYDVTQNDVDGFSADYERIIQILDIDSIPPDVSSSAHGVENPIGT